VFSNSPCRETPKNALKKKEKKKARTYFFCELAQMYVVFSFYFFCRPLAFGKHLGLAQALPAAFALPVGLGAWRNIPTFKTTFRANDFE
jgi:hypothetical protein